MLRILLHFAICFVQCLTRASLLLELVLSTLFDTNKGLLSFLNNELKRPVRQKSFDTAMKESFHLLEFVMEQFADVFDPYIIEAKVLYYNLRKFYFVLLNRHVYFST